MAVPQAEPDTRVASVEPRSLDRPAEAVEHHSLDPLEASVEPRNRGYLSAAEARHRIPDDLQAEVAEHHNQGYLQVPVLVEHRNRG